MQKNYQLLFAVLGIVAPILLFLAITILGVFWRNYNPIQGYISDLGAAVSPFEWVVNIFGFVLLGIIMIGFSFVLEQHVDTNNLSRTALRMFLGGSIFVILLGFFHTDLRNAPVTLDGQIHTIFGSAAFLLLSLSLIWYGRVFLWDDKWENFWQVISVFLGSMALVAGAFIEFVPKFYYNGTIERLGIGAILLWIFFVSINLFLKEEFKVV